MLQAPMFRDPLALDANPLPGHPAAHGRQEVPRRCRGCVSDDLWRGFPSAGRLPANAPPGDIESPITRWSLNKCGTADRGF